MRRVPVFVPPGPNVRRAEGPETWGCPSPTPSAIRNFQSSPGYGLGRNWWPTGKHVVNEAVCSPATYWVLDEFPAALVPVGTVVQARHLQNVLLFVYLIVLTANPINKNLSVNKELKHLIGPEFGVEVLKKCGCQELGKKYLRWLLSGDLGGQL